MDDAYTIGITLALENGVSEGLAIIRRDLEALDLAIAHTADGLAGLRRAGNAAIAGAGLDFAQLAAEGKRLLGGLASVPAPSLVRRSPEIAANAAEKAAPASAGAARKATPAGSVANVPPREWPPFEVAAPQRPAVPVGPVPPTPAASSERISEPASPPAPAVPSTALAPHAAPALREMPPHVAPVARETPPHVAPVAYETPPRVHVDLLPAHMLPTVPSPAQMLQTSVTPTVPAPSQLAAGVSVAPVTERPASIPAAAAAPPITLTVSDLSALARSAVPEPVPVSSPGPAQLSLLGATAAPKPVFGPMPGSRAVGRTGGGSVDIPVGWRGRTEWPSETEEPTSLSNATVPAPWPMVGPWVTTTIPPGSARPLDTTPPSQPASSGPEMGNIMLDGQLVGHWMSDRLAREAHRAPSGPTGFDPKLGFVWPGAPIVT